MIRASLVLIMSLVTASSTLAAQGDAGTLTGVIRDSSGGAIPGATIQVVNEATSAALDAVTDPEGAFRVAPLAPGSYRVHATLDGFDPVMRRVAVEAGSAAAIDLTLSPSRLTESVVVTARRVEQVAQEVPIPLSVLSGELAENAGAFNVNRVKELIPDRPVLLLESPQFLGDHSRDWRTLRAHQRRHRAGRRALHRRRLLRAARGRHSRFSGRRAGRGAARPAGDAFREEHDGRRHQRDEPPARLHAPHRGGAGVRQLRVRAGEGLGLRTPDPKARGPVVVLRHVARRLHPEHRQ